VLAGLGLLTGCGGGSSDSTRSTPASGGLSKAEWLAQANEICKAEGEDVAPLNKELDQLNESGLTAPKETAEFAAILRKALPRSERGIRELRELESPSDKSHAIDAVLEKDEETLELTEKTAEEMEEGNIAAAKFLSLKAAMANRTAQWMAQRDGLKLCETESRTRRQSGY
ncbi:MAG TPA: hypothetical protein VII45_10170, partial [Solirubrobacterales bacterium]